MSRTVLGSVRKTDSAGRVQLPADIREAVGIESNTDLNVYLQDGRIVIEPVMPLKLHCAMCQKELKTTVSSAPAHSVVCPACAKLVIKMTGGRADA